MRGKASHVVSFVPVYNEDAPSRTSTLTGCHFNKCLKPPYLFSKGTYIHSNNDDLG